MDEIKEQITQAIVDYVIIGGAALVCYGTLKLVESAKTQIKNKINEKRRGANEMHIN